MNHRPTLVFVAALAAGGIPGGGASAQEATRAAACRDIACAVDVDWTREGGIGGLLPDRRYGNPVAFEESVKASLAARGFTRYNGGGDDDLRITLLPRIGRAMCDEIAGTSTDMSCRAITEVEARLAGREAVRRNVDLPSRIRNRCSSDRAMPVDKFSVFVADWIIYALEGKATGERRPVARC